MVMKSFKLPEATDPADGRDRVTISPIPPTSHRLLSKIKGQQRDVFSISLDFAFTRHPCDVCRMLLSSSTVHLSHFPIFYDSFFLFVPLHSSFPSLSFLSLFIMFSLLTSTK